MYPYSDYEYPYSDYEYPYSDLQHLSHSRPDPTSVKAKPFRLIGKALWPYSSPPTYPVRAILYPGTRPRAASSPARRNTGRPVATRYFAAGARCVAAMPLRPQHCSAEWTCAAGGPIASTRSYGCADSVEATGHQRSVMMGPVIRNRTCCKAEQHVATAARRGVDHLYELEVHGRTRRDVEQRVVQQQLGQHAVHPRLLLPEAAVPAQMWAGVPFSGAPARAS